MKFNGKSALVTGGSDGIGLAIAAGLLKEGARVVLVARREEKLTEVVQKLGPGASYLAMDVADTSSAERAVAETVARHGGLDLLVNNAGILLAGAVGKQSVEDVDRMLAVNLRATILFTQAAVPAMTGRPGAAVLMISSAATRETVVGAAVYGATKAALNYLAKAWAIELAPAGIRVNGLSPGATETPTLHAAERAIPGLIATHIATNLVKRIATAEEVAEIALMLLDEQKGGYVTGAVWDIDGGFRLG